MEKVYYQDDYSTLAINETLPCLFQKFKGIAHSSDHYKKIQDISINLISEKLHHFENLNLLVDSSEAGSITLEDIEYHRNQVMPLLYSKGIRFIAYVPPTAKISRIIFSEVFRDLFIDNLVIKQFDSVVDAKKTVTSASQKKFIL